MKVRLIDIHVSDAYYIDRDELIDVVGQGHGFFFVAQGWYAFDFIPDHLRTPIHLTCANFEKI